MNVCHWYLVVKTDMQKLVLLPLISFVVGARVQVIKKNLAMFNGYLTQTKNVQ